MMERLAELLRARQPVRPILSPFPGESAVGISPRLDRTVDPLWNRRANVFTGRSLSDTVLTMEQAGRAGHLVAAGTMLSSGTIRGLDIALERDASGEFLVLTPGHGITSTGEDVIVATSQRIRVQDVPVIASGLTSGDAPAASRLGELLAAGTPVVGVLVLQPIVVEQVADADPRDPCEQDPQNFAFEDWQLVDGCRLVCVLWEDSWVPRPPFDGQWRNRLAYELFRWEQQHPSLDTPWNTVGLPIAMLAGRNGTVLFLDSAAVVRMGGKRPWKQGLLARTGTPFLWQARLQQFGEQVVEMQTEAVAIEGIAQAFRFLPPAGLLPKDALTIGDAGVTERAWTNRFFPAGFRLDLDPVPIEQLDTFLTSCASLAPLDMTSPETVRVLVPVPQSSFEPDLLRVAKVDPEFQTTINEFVEKRGKWLRRRNDLREIASALNRAIRGMPITFSNPDPEALDTTETPAENPILGTEGPLAQSEDVYETTATPAGTGVTHTVNDLEALRTALSTSTPLSAAEVGELSKRGVTPFIDFLEEKVRRANDTVDFGFLHVQANIYRIRQLMLGNDAASRLVTSPALASIAQGESALATREDLATFLKDHGGKLPTVRSTPAGAGPGATAGSRSREMRASIAPKAETVVRSGTSLFVNLSDVALRPGVVTKPELMPGGVEGIKLQPKPSETEIVEKLKAGSGGGVLKPDVVEKVAGVQDVENQAPIIGKPLDFRTTSLAERLKEPPVPEAKNFSVAAKSDVVSSLSHIDLNLDDVEIPGFLEKDAAGKLNPVSKTVKMIKDGKLTDQILKGLHDPDPTDGDEGAFFSAGVRAIDNSVATLRIVEGQIAGYRQAIAKCQGTLASLRATALRLDQRLRVVGDELAEARHDVAVARSLLAEEEARVNAINERRGQVLREQVKFYAFVRPRQTIARMDVPVRSLDPGLVASPVPACLAGHEDVPQELRDMVALFRQAPVKWFPRFPGLLEKLDRVDLLQRTIAEAKINAQVHAAQLNEPLSLVGTDRLAHSVVGVYMAQRAVIAERRLELAQVDLAPINHASWVQQIGYARELLSLSDVLEGRHGQAELARQASRELADMSNVATCLYTQFGSVRPVLRLGWAERLSQFDAPANLRNLSSLPRWGEVPVVDRRTMQTLADWLYSRIDAGNVQAVGLMHDLIRLCLLLASHAPVKQIIAGHVIQPITVKPGSRLPLAISPGSIRIGMQVAFYAGEKVVAQGLVEDVGGGQAVARVVQTAHPTVMLAAQSVAHFSQAARTFIQAQ